MVQPAWLAFATPTVALLALIVATFSLVTARRTYYRAGALVHGSAQIFVSGSGKVLLSVSLFNSGLASIGVDSILVGWRDASVPESSAAYATYSTEGPQLPHVLAAGTSGHWRFLVELVPTTEGYVFAVGFEGIAGYLKQKCTIGDSHVLAQFGTGTRLEIPMLYQ